MTYIVKGDKTNYKVNETLTGRKNMFDRSGKRYFTIEYKTELFYGNYYKATEMVSADYYEVAVAKAQEEGIWAFGPYSADGFFGAGQYNHFDAVLAMYHDQGLAPFKALDMSGVNFTAGLRVVRTSPDHGTAYGITGKNEASETSMLHAIYAAIDILHCREENQKLLDHQLVVEVREVKKEYKVEKFIPQ